MNDYARIREALGRLRASRIASKGVCAESHRFAVNPPLTEDAVRAFEKRHGIVLPGDYHGFLIHVGNGGAGPAYGVLRLGELEASGARRQPWAEGDGYVGILAEPFPHTEPWNDLSGKPEYVRPRKQDKTYERAYCERLGAWQESHYYLSAHVNGAIPICDLGCALRQWLVVTGPEAGHIWEDARTDEAGLFPVEPDEGEGERVTFLAWYRDWLNDALRKLK